VQRYVRLLVWCARVRRAHVCFVRFTLTFFCRIAHDRAPSNVPSHGPARSAVRPSGARACLRACSAASLSAAAPYLADEPGAVEVRPAKTYECACAQALRRGCVDASGGICSRPSRGSRAGSPTLQRNMVLHRRDARWFGRDESSVRPAKMDEEQRTSYVRVLSALGLLSPLWSAAGAAGSAGPDVVRERPAPFAHRGKSALAGSGSALVGAWSARGPDRAPRLGCRGRRARCPARAPGG
jgi:hypothetical protein